MSTKIYGTSDDLVEIEGDVRGEVSHYVADGDKEAGVLLVCSDGTVLAVKYGKPIGGIWDIQLIRDGSLFLGIDLCEDEESDPYSDVARFSDGLKWVIAATQWERVR